ncbi:MAG: flagellar FliJ family protein [Melioribacteraceae bacterium]|jgi:flagellar export protein FliJ|nr:flagellar FliJ family protein [Melioribacteraceae bacterium]
MKKFNYKFESILNVKENFKKQAMKEVAEIGRQIEEKLEKKEQLILELKECKQSSQKILMKVSELQFIESHIYFINKKIQFVESELLKLKLVLKMKQKILVEKTKESKIFHKLKESKFMKHKSEENKEELEMLDELAIQKSSRN